MTFHDAHPSKLSPCQQPSTPWILPPHRYHPKMARSRGFCPLTKFAAFLRCFHRRKLVASLGFSLSHLVFLPAVEHLAITSGLTTQGLVQHLISSVSLQQPTGSQESTPKRSPRKPDQLLPVAREVRRRPNWFVPNGATDSLIQVQKDHK